ncbi:MAG: class I SAM-dependent methyltransferase [Methanomicrobiales archaeon]|nr:class I SAM-dependent methyltransferase [Methanomicrobiales archaeon]
MSLHPADPRIRVFDDNAGFYDRWFEENREEYAQELSFIRRHTPQASPSLEIGAGTGRFAAPLGMDVALEPSREMARLARCRDVEVVRGLAECVPFHTGTFSLVLMITVDCYLQDISRSFSEIRRVLSPEGFFVVAFIERKSPLGVYYTKTREKSRFLSLANFHTSGEISGYLIQAGFCLPVIYSLSQGFSVLVARPGR